MPARKRSTSPAVRRSGSKTKKAAATPAKAAEASPKKETSTKSTAKPANKPPQQQESSPVAARTIRPPKPLVDVEHVERHLEARRQQITVLRAPLTTLALFLRHFLTWLVDLLSRFFGHPVTIWFIMPALVAAGCYSVFVVPDLASAAFHAIDENDSLTVTAHEIAQYYAERHPENHWTLPHFQEHAGHSAEHGITKDDFKKWWKAASAEVRASHAFDYHPWRELEYFLADCMWWLVLGILSSVGLGSGMHSGILFLFPHIFLTCAAANLCGHTDFYTYPTNPFFGPKARTFQCIHNPEGAEMGDVAFLPRFLKVLIWVVVWGSGTAIGEIPPYLLAYTAAKEGRKTDELDEVSQFDIFNRMKNWTLDKIQRWGFLAVFLLASWPNATFDMCGMACGQFLMPFWTFFGATLLGKGFVKAPSQAVFFVLLFSGRTVQAIVQAGGEAVSSLGLDVTPYAAKAVNVLDDLQRKTALRAQGGAEAEGAQAASIISTLMGWFVTIAVGWFAMSIIDTFAQKQQEEDDEVKLERLRTKRAQEQRDYADELIAAGRLPVVQIVIDVAFILAGVSVAVYGHFYNVRSFTAFGHSSTASQVALTIAADCLGLSRVSPVLLIMRALSLGVVGWYTLQ